LINIYTNNNNNNNNNNNKRFHISSERPGDRTLHLSYHGEMHYNSVRTLSDRALPKTPPEPITIKLFQAPLDSSQGSGGGGGGISSGMSEAERLVSISLPHVSLADIKATLEDVEGNADHAIELLVSGYIPLSKEDITVGAYGDSNSSSSGGGGGGGGENDEIEFDEEFLRALDDIDKVDAVSSLKDDSSHNGDKKSKPSSSSSSPGTNSQSANGSNGKSKQQRDKNGGKSSSSFETEAQSNPKPTRQGLCHCGSMKK
jgi:hypothetical protein